MSERKVETEFAPTEQMPGWHRYLIYIEVAKRRCEIPMSYDAWAMQFDEHGRKQEESNHGPDVA